MTSCPAKKALNLRGTGSSSRMRIGLGTRGARFFEYRYRQLAADGREVIKEHLQRITGLEVIE